MTPLRVLIVEDEPLVSMLIEDVVTETVPSVVVVKTSVVETKMALEEHFDLALLDVDVTNGQTYEVARLLQGKRISFAFVSGAIQEYLPPDLKDARFIRKPFHESQIRGVVLEAYDARKP